MTFPCYPEYKESGVEWLGLVPAAWRVVRTFHLGVCIRTGKVDVNIQEEDGIYPFFTCSKDAKKARQFSFDCEALLVAGNGEVGYTQYYKGKFEAYQRTYVLSDFGDMNARFLQYHYMENLVVSVKGKSIGSVIQFITLNDLRDFPVPIPSQSEQTQIARFLDHETARIDALIEEQQRLIELLKEKRQAVISHAVTKGLDPTVPMKDSGVEWLGEVPAHWIVTKIKYICYVNDGNHGEEYPKSDDFTTEDNGVPFIRGGNLENYKVSDSDMLFITPEKNRSMRKGRLMSGDILFVNRGEIGKLAMVPSAHAGSNLNSQIAYLRLISPEFINGFLMYYLDGEGVKSLIASSKEGSVLTQFPIGDLNSIYVAAPPKCEQEKIVIFLSQKVNGFDALISEAVTGVELLKERRSALISAAVTGKIDVRGWQPPASTQAPKLEVAEAV